MHSISANDSPTVSNIHAITDATNSAQYENLDAGHSPIGWNLSAIARRMSHLFRQLLSTESTQSERFVEVESRIGAMINEVSAVTQNMQVSMQQAEQMRQQSQQNFTVASAEISNGLLQLEQALSEKLSKVAEVVQGLERVGKELELIAVNAAIQAAHAGEAGRTFSVVAEHVRELARNTIQNSKEVSKMLDFQDFQQQLIGFGQSSVVNVSNVDREIGEAFAKVQNTFTQSNASMDVLVDHGRVIETMHQLDKGSYQRQRGKVEWAKQIADELEKSGHVGDVRLPEQLRRVLRKEGSNKAPDYDRLQDILQRGVLRVAIEPAFKGLSFRLNAGGPLRGLDVEYASAFAEFLGVDIEFVEHPWDQCVDLLHIGRQRGEAEVDLVWSALPPNATYHGVAYSEAYTYLHYVLARRVGDNHISGLSSLQGKILGCINDPAAFATLEAAGLRWSKHKREERDTVRLANLIGYTDQSIIHDALAEGKVDAFAVDQPIFAWACYGKDSPWQGRIEMLKGNIASTPWYYTVAVADSPSSYALLNEINTFIDQFSRTPERQALEQRWQYSPVQGNASYRDEPGALKGEQELYEDWANLQAP
ncbi:MAG: methyl-accepting chemotaxis protein [Methylophilaceae bacterium]